MRIAGLAAAISLLLAGAAHAQLPFTTAPTPADVVPAAEFLAKNKDAAGVKTTASGLQYKVIASGPAGPSPKRGDAIKVHYEGALTNGRVFDSSFQRGRPMLAPLEDMIPGWMEAIPMMHVGDEWMIYLPPSLAYGPEGDGPIPPNAVLVFRVKLLGMLSAD